MMVRVFFNTTGQFILNHSMFDFFPFLKKNGKLKKTLLKKKVYSAIKTLKFSVK